VNESFIIPTMLNAFLSVRIQGMPSEQYDEFLRDFDRAVEEADPVEYVLTIFNCRSCGAPAVLGRARCEYCSMPYDPTGQYKVTHTGDSGISCPLTEDITTVGFNDVESMTDNRS